MAEKKDVLLASVSADIEMMEKRLMPGIADLLEVYGAANAVLEQYDAFLRQADPVPLPVFTTDSSATPKY